jgi:hypothetical protein
MHQRGRAILENFIIRQLSSSEGVSRALTPSDSL